MNDEMKTLLEHRHNSGVYWSKSKVGTYNQSIKDAANDYYFFYLDATNIADSETFLLKFSQVIETPEPEESATNLDVLLDDLRGISYYHNPSIDTYIIFVDGISDFAVKNPELFNKIIRLFGLATQAWYDVAPEKRLSVLMTGDKMLKPELAVLEV